jgi:hypothetical protein
MEEVHDHSVEFKNLRLQFCSSISVGVVQLGPEYSDLIAATCHCFD